MSKDSTLEQRVAGALIDLVEVMTSPDTSRMVASMEKLDAIVASDDGQLHPRVKHFLERRSYAKALAWMQGNSPSAPSGACSSDRS